MITDKYQIPTIEVFRLDFKKHLLCLSRFFKIS